MDKVPKSLADLFVWVGRSNISYHTMGAVLVYSGMTTFFCFARIMLGNGSIHIFQMMLTHAALAGSVIMLAVFRREMIRDTAKMERLLDRIKQRNEALQQIALELDAKREEWKEKEKATNTTPMH